MLAILRAVRRTGEEQKASSADAEDPLTRGIHAFMSGDYVEAFDLLLPGAEAGSVRAQNLLSRMYFAGNGVEKDAERYRYWLQRAADNGDRTAKAKLKRLARSAPESSANVPLDAGRKLGDD